MSITRTNQLIKKRDSAPIPTEHEEQVAFVRWMSVVHPNARIFAIPNGGFRAASTAKALKAEGVRAGVPDLFIPAWGAFIEMKRRKNSTTSLDQKEWIDYLKRCGYKVFICKGFDDAVAIVATIDKSRQLN